MNTWLYDKSGNRASIERWGNTYEAERSLKTLKECKNCTDCINCIRCTDCKECVDCNDCIRCMECCKCLDSTGCTECVHCASCLSCVWCCLCVSNVDCSYCYYNDDYFGRKNNYPATYPIPIIENIHRSVYAAASNKLALNMADWHSCDTCHCRAGWVVTLAGSAGAKLESKISTLFAAMLIYKASDPVNKVSVLRFYDSNENAIADMKRLAELVLSA